MVIFLPISEYGTVVEQRALQLCSALLCASPFVPLLYATCAIVCGAGYRRCAVVTSGRGGRDGLVVLILVLVIVVVVVVVVGVVVVVLWCRCR